MWSQRLELPRPVCFVIRNKSEWVAPYPLEPSAGGRIGRGVWEVWGFSRSGNWKKSSGEAGLRFLPIMGTVGRGRCCSCCLGSETDAQRNLLNVCGGVGGGLLTAMAPWIQGCQSQSLSFRFSSGLSAGPLWLCLGQLDFIRGDPDLACAPLPGPSC